MHVCQNEPSKDTQLLLCFWEEGFPHAVHTPSSSYSLDMRELQFTLSYLVIHKVSRFQIEDFDGRQKSSHTRWSSVIWSARWWSCGSSPRRQIHHSPSISRSCRSLKTTTNYRRHTCTNSSPSNSTTMWHYTTPRGTWTMHGHTPRSQISSSTIFRSAPLKGSW